jgi:hypothetical protein
MFQLHYIRPTARLLYGQQLCDHGLSVGSLRQCGELRESPTVETRLNARQSLLVDALGIWL